MVSVSGLIASAIGNPVTYDFLKFISAQGLARLKDRTIRKRVLQDTQKRLLHNGLLPEQAEHLVQLVKDKRWLERGASLDVQRLSDLVTSEVKEAGYLPLEAELLYHALVSSIALAAGGNSFQTSMSVRSYLKDFPESIHTRTLVEFAHAMRHPEQLGAELLGDILQQAGQHQARLAVNHQKQLELVGPYQLHFQAKGEDALILQNAAMRAVEGEVVTLDEGQLSTLTVTAGHPVLDRLLHLHPSDKATLRLGPVPTRLPLRIRSQGGLEVLVDAELTPVPDGGVDVIFVNRPDLRFTIRMTAENWQWSFHFDLQDSAISIDDQAVLQAIRLLTSGKARVFDQRTGELLFTFTESRPQVRAVHASASFILDLLDVARFAGLQTGMASNLLMDEPISQSLLDRVSMAARLARHELIDETVSYLHAFDLTEYWATTFKPHQKFWSRATFQIPFKQQPLKLTVEWRCPRATFKDSNGRKLPRHHLPQAIGTAVQLKIVGKVAQAELVHSQE